MMRPAGGRKTPTKALRNWVPMAIAAVAVSAVAVVIASFWSGLGKSEISLAGWIAMGLGIILTLALGIGLMALVFISSRRGYDEIGGKDH
jgi:dipeptide/tripeptide permease